MATGAKSAFRRIETYDLLPPEPGRRRPPVPANRSGSIEDAVYEVIGPADRLFRPGNDDRPAGRTARVTGLTAFVAAFAARFAGSVERQLRRLSPQSFATLLSALFLAVFWLFGGFSALANANRVPAVSQALSVEKMFTRHDDANGMTVLEVGGQLVNHGSETRFVPELLVIRTDTGARIGSIRPAALRLGGGARIGFSARFKFSGGKSVKIAIVAKSG